MHSMSSRDCHVAQCASVCTCAPSWIASVIGLVSCVLVALSQSLRLALIVSRASDL
jgi:hypothetical protein